MTLQMVGASKVLATDLACEWLATRLMLLLMQLQQGSAAQLRIANGTRKIIELGVSDENVTLIAGLGLKRLWTVWTIDVAKLRDCINAHIRHKLLELSVCVLVT